MTYFELYAYPDWVYPTKPPSSPPAADTVLTLEGSMKPYQWTVNNKAVQVPKRPITIDPNSADPPTKQLAVPISEGFSLVILNTTGMNHPFHLHGHSFYLLAWGETASGVSDMKRLL